MKITGVRTTMYEFEMARPLGDANLPSGSSKAAGLAIFLDTDQGVSGVMSGNPGAQEPDPREALAEIGYSWTT